MDRIEPGAVGLFLCRASKLDAGFIEVLRKLLRGLAEAVGQPDRCTGLIVKTGALQSGIALLGTVVPFVT